MSLDEVGVACTYSEAADLVGELAEEPGSHLHAAVRGWSEPMSRLERDTRQLAQAVLNFLRAKDAPWIDLGWPWPDPDAVSEEEREALMDQLKQRSAFRD